MRITQTSAEFPSPTGFLVVEGVNGAGKGTFIEKLSAHLSANGIKVTCTREPGGTPVGGAIRKILLESGQGALTPLSEVFLFAADRAHHVNSLIKPKLAQKNCVISDRYYFSTLAFQGYGRGLDLGQLKQINKIAIQDANPDIVILLDLEPAEGLSRTQSRDTAVRDDFEKEDLDFHRRLRSGFLELADNLSDKFLVLDASQSPENIFAEALKVIGPWLSALKKSWGIV